VKVEATRLGLAVSQPGTRRDLVEALEGAGPHEVAVVTAYGMILAPPALTVPRRGMVNLHFSLLPRWRGAAPVPAAIGAGDPETGVSLMQIDEGLDTGPLLAAVAVPIDPDEDAGTLSARLAEVGARLLAQSLPGFLEGSLTPVAQDSQRATYAPQLKPGDRVLDPNSDPEALARQVRAMAPRPGATLRIDGLPHRILSARVRPQARARGTIAIEEESVMLGGGRQSLELLVIQAPGGRPIDATAWARGRRRPPRLDS
jgi:methionyl-tRNA formyltransferase